MAKSNIYDLHLSEILLRTCCDFSGNAGAGAAGANVPSLALSSSIGATMPASLSTQASFTSEVIGMPAFYTVQGVTHVITYPDLTTTVGSSTPLTGALQTVVSGLVGTTYTVTSTVVIEDLVNAIPGVDITLTATMVITAVLPTYYGVKVSEAIPTITSLYQISSSSTQFSMTTSVVGRMYVVIPTAISSVTPMLTLAGPNGLTYPASDFAVSTFAVGANSYDYYILNYDTQLTGTNVKTFTINFS
jgi:hypothetical protein